MKTLILSSSLSPESKSFILCEYVDKKLREFCVDSELIDARELKLLPYYRGPTKDMIILAEKVELADNIIIGLGIHNYSINASLKIILEDCFDGAKEKFFGILCTAGGNKSYLATQHLTQICMNEWRMIQLPRIVYATDGDFNDNKIINKDAIERINQFCEEFKKIGEKLLK